MGKPRGNPAVTRVLRLCRSAITAAYPLGKRLGTGMQGAVFKSHGKTVIKVSASGQREHDAGAVMWIRQFKLRTRRQVHPSLPHVYTLQLLRNCLVNRPGHRAHGGRSGRHIPAHHATDYAYVTHREDLATVPRFAGYNAAMDLLNDLSDHTYGIAGTRAGLPPSRFRKARAKDIAKLPREARKMFDDIFSLHVWAWDEGILILDACDVNIGVRYTGRGRQYVLRDPGLIYFRSTAPAWAKNCWSEDWLVSRMPAPLGGID